MKTIPLTRASRRVQRFPVLAATLFAFGAATAHAGALTPITFNLPGGDQLYSVAFDASGNIWAALNRNSIAEINPSNGAITNTYTTSGLTGLSYGNTAIDSSGNLYAAVGYSGAKLWDFNTTTHTFTSYSTIGGQTVYDNSVNVDSSGNIWTATYNGFLSFSSPSGTPTVYGLSEDAATLNGGGNDSQAGVVTGSSLVYSIETYGGGYELGILNINSPGSNIEYDPLMSITGGGTLSNAVGNPVEDSEGNVYTIDAGNPVSTLYELNTTSDTWTAIDTLPRENSPLAYAFDSSGNLWQVGQAGNTLLEYDLGAPEPSTWMLLAAGLGFIALGSRRTGASFRKGTR